MISVVMEARCLNAGEWGGGVGSLLCTWTSRQMIRYTMFCKLFILRRLTTLLLSAKAASTQPNPKLRAADELGLFEKVLMVFSSCSRAELSQQYMISYNNYK